MTLGLFGVAKSNGALISTMLLADPGQNTDSDDEKLILEHSDQHSDRQQQKEQHGWRLRLFMIGKALLTGFGFMCDAYDLFVINLILAIMKYLYPQTSQDSSLVASCVVIGAVAGQLVFGALGDRIGRKPALIATFCLLVFGSIASAVLSWPFPGFGIYACLALWRFVLGFGIGGEYPLSATASSEQSSHPHHVALTFSMQGLGNLLAPLTVTVLLTIFSQGTGRVRLPSLCFFSSPSAYDCELCDSRDG